MSLGFEAVQQIYAVVTLVALQAHMLLGCCLHHEHHNHAAHASVQKCLADLIRPL